MTELPPKGASDLAELRRHLAACLVARRVEIEADADVRIRAVSDPGEAGDPAYVEGLAAALSASVDYALSGLEGEVGDRVSIPVALLAQARLAARNRVSLDTVLRRYFAGFTLFSDFVMAEAAAGPYSAEALQHVMRIQAFRFDRLIAGVTAEYGEERTRRPGSSDERRMKQVEDLLHGELMASEKLDYDFSASSVGAVATGPDVGGVMRQLADGLDYRLLLVNCGDGYTWAWLGAGRGIDVGALVRATEKQVGGGSLVSYGEPARTLAGWRLTHRQAKAAHAVGVRGDRRVVRYGDVALVASILGDDLFAASLQELFLAPLLHGPNRGSNLLKTLRAYFAADRNVSSAAAALGISRQTVMKRLKVAEQRIGRPLNDCSAEMEAALRLEEIEQSSTQGGLPNVRRMRISFVHNVHKDFQI